MNLTQILNRVPEYRVNASTYAPSSETKTMIGGEFTVSTIDYEDEIVSLYTKGKSNFWTFNFSDVQELTPLSFNGKRIAIGDEVQHDEGDVWQKVVFCSPFEDEWGIEIIDEDDDVVFCPVNDITAHRTPTSTTRTLEDVLSTLPDSDKEIIRKAVK